MASKDFVTIGISVLALVIATGSLTWNIVLFVLQGARPQVKAILGMRIGSGITFLEASKGDVIAQLRENYKKYPNAEFRAGVVVINRGRLPLHIHQWGFEVTPVGLKSIPPAEAQLNDWPAVVAAGAQALLTTPWDNVRDLWNLVPVNKRRAVVCTVTTGDDRTIKTAPLPAKLFD